MARDEADDPDWFRHFSAIALLYRIGMTTVEGQELVLSLGSWAFKTVSSTTVDERFFRERLFLWLLLWFVDKSGFLFLTDSSELVKLNDGS